MYPEATSVVTSLRFKVILESTIPGLRWARLPIVADGLRAQSCHLKLVALSLAYIGHGSLDLVGKLQQVYGEGCWDVQTELPAIEHLNGLVLCVPKDHLFWEVTVVNPPSRNHLLVSKSGLIRSPSPP